MGLGWRFTVLMISPGITAAMNEPNPFDLFDNFYDTNGTFVTNHPMDKGAGWIIVDVDLGGSNGGIGVASQFTIQNNKIQFGRNNTAVVAAGGVDITTTVDWTPRGVGDDFNSIIIEYTDVNNFTFLNFRRGTANDIAIVEVSLGVVAVKSFYLGVIGTRTPFTFNINQTYHIEANKNINLANCKIDGVIPTGFGAGNVAPNNGHFQGLIRNIGNSSSELDNFRTEK